MVPTLAQVEPVAQPISIQTALLIIFGIAFLLAIKSLANLHRRVDALAASVRPQKAPAARAAAEPVLPPEIVAVISAAVYESVGNDFRIVAISTDGQGTTWSMEGRRQIFGSRKVR
jgi:hypothetical protein